MRVLVLHFINTTTFAARDFWPRRGASDAHTLLVCKERATTSGPKRTAAQRVAPLFGSGFVAPRSQPHSGDAPSSRLARTENRRNKRGRIYETEYLG